MIRFTSKAFMIVQKVNEGGYGSTTKIRGLYNKIALAEMELARLNKNARPHYKDGTFKIVTVPVQDKVCVPISSVYE